MFRYKITDSLGTSYNDEGWSSSVIIVGYGSIVFINTWIVTVFDGRKYGGVMQT